MTPASRRSRVTRLRHKPQAAAPFWKVNGRRNCPIRSSPFPSLIDQGSYSQMYQPREQFPSGQRFGIEFGGAVLSFERVTDVLRRQWPLIAAALGVSLALVIV